MYSKIVKIAFFLRVFIIFVKVPKYLFDYIVVINLDMKKPLTLATNDDGITAPG